MRSYRSISRQGAATARAEFDAPAAINAPLFRSLIQMLEEDRRWVVLDLGAARPQTIGLLNRYRCRLDVADIASGIKSLSVASDSIVLGDRINALVPTCHTERTDITLCWDFLNYFERDALTVLMANIAARSRPGAFVHALIVYSDKVMQDQPGQFVPVDEGHLLNASTAKPSRIAPRYSTEDLRLCLPDFSIERVRLLGNGMQEYLFRR